MPAVAHDRPPAERLFEVTPFIGYRLGGDFELEPGAQDVDLGDSRAFAVALDLRADPWSQYELFYGRQQSELQANEVVGRAGVKIEYLHIGGTLVVNEEPRVQPYIVGTLGATRFAPEPAQAEDETRFSFSLGAGLRVPLNPRFALRLEARGYLTVVDSDSALFCASGAEGGVCLLRASGSTFVQYEFLAGAAFAF